MNIRFLKWLLSVAVFFCVILVATNVAAVKPVKPPPDDPCLSMDSFSPDYVFYRDSAQRKNSKSTIFLAESATGCERTLVEIPTVAEDGRYIDIRYLKYSSFIEQGDTFGRVIWHSNSGTEEIVWSYDFYISGTALIPDDDGIRKILVTDDYWNKRVTDYDLSPDTAMLAFQLFRNDPVTGESDSSIRVIDIDYCRVLDSGCSYEEERAVVLAETSVSDPTWDPLGRRVYFLKRSDQGYKELQFIEFDEGWENEAWPPSFISRNLYSSEIQPEFQLVRGIASGIMDGTEYLAVEFRDEERTNCGYIYFINVEACENPEDAVCRADLKFAGTNPSWTKDGKVIHHYDDPKINRFVCSLWGGKVGLYDGFDVNELTDGYFPDGAGGLPE